jgi:regulatory protein
VAEPRTAALDWALRALRRQDLTTQELDRRLAARGFPEDEREQACTTLARTGLVDDRRFAENRALTLAARGAGDALIRHALESVGVDRELIDDALRMVEPEAERARRIVGRRGAGPKTSRYLSRRGFSEEVVAGSLRATGAASEDRAAFT